MKEYKPKLIEYKTPKRLMTVSEFAEYARVKNATIFGWMAEGRIPYYRLSLQTIRLDPDILMKYYVPALTPPSDDTVDKIMESVIRIRKSLRLMNVDNVKILLNWNPALANL